MILCIFENKGATELYFNRNENIKTNIKIIHRGGFL